MEDRSGDKERMISVSGTPHIYNNQWTQAEIQIQGLVGSKVEINMKGGKLADERSSYRMMEFPKIELVGKTAERNLTMIEECLMGDEVRMIGVYGMGGVGKTTIMTNIYNKMIRNTEKFKNVIWVMVSNIGNRLEDFQDRILKVLDPEKSFYHNDALCRSAELLQYFKEKEKFLLILDDVWSIYVLTEVGVPEPNEENKCKIVWTTRFRSVCEGMESQKTIKVSCLTEDESWTLFKEKLKGKDLVLSSIIEPIAKNIVRECDGLPLAIITVGASMKCKKSIQSWSSALEDLIKSRPDQLVDLENKVFSKLRFSFDMLRSDRHQGCFLYCALYPEDYRIKYDELVENWLAEGFLDEFEDRKRAFDKGYEIVDDLKDACMLESGEYEYTVKMHDLMRDLAINITKQGTPRFLVHAGFRTERFRMDEKTRECERMSLMWTAVKSLSCQTNHPKLSTLFLRECKMLDNLDHEFFEHMPNLRVLDLSSTLITCLPQSLSNLINLRSLNLKWCQHLKEVPSVENLKELRVLNLSYTSIQHLPEGMNGLTNLRRLDLSCTGNLTTFPVGILSNFSHLEELLMKYSQWIWSSNSNGEGAGVEEIASLRHLRKLLVGIKDLTALFYYVRHGNWRDLTYFYIAVPCWNYPWVGDPRGFYSEVRVVDLCEIRECVRSLAVPENTRTLRFFKCDNIFPLSEIPCLWRLKQLENIHISEIITEAEEYVVTETEKPFLPNLSVLAINHAHNIWTICKEPARGGTTLANLKHVRISSCRKLKYLFSVGWLQTFRYLEVIQVWDCPAIEEIVVELEDKVEANSCTDGDAITLPRLKELDLLRLSHLRSISKRTLICNSLETFNVRHCLQLKMLPLSINNIPPSLKEMNITPMSCGTCSSGTILTPNRA